MVGKTNANIGFEKQLWDAACVLWGHIPAAEYRKVTLSTTAAYMIAAAVLAVCSCRVQNSLRPIPENAVLFLSMGRKLTLTLGRWLR